MPVAFYCFLKIIGDLIHYKILIRMFCFSSDPGIGEKQALSVNSPFLKKNNKSSYTSIILLKDIFDNKQT